MQTLTDENQKEQLMSRCRRFSYLLLNHRKGRTNVERLVSGEMVAVVVSHCGILPTETPTKQIRLNY